MRSTSAASTSGTRASSRGLFNVLVAGQWEAPLGSRGDSRAVAEWLRLAAIPETVPELLSVAHHSDQDGRRLALNVLSESEWGPEASDALRAGASSDDAAVRAAAAEVPRKAGCCSCRRGTAASQPATACPTVSGSTPARRVPSEVISTPTGRASS
jgi:hypothetical protein